MAKLNKSKNLPLWLQSFLNKFKRANKDKNKLLIKSPKDFFVKFIKFEKSFLRFIVILFFIGLVVFIIFNYYNQYKKLEFNSFYNNEDKVSLNIFDDNQNVAFLGVERGEGGNNYTQFLQILSFNKRLKTLSILGVDSYYLASFDGGLFTFKTLLNSIDESDTVKLNKYMDSIESFLGVRVDGYIIADTKELGELITNQDLSINIEESYKSETKFYNISDLIKGSELKDYLFLKEYSRDENEITLRSINFTKSFLVQSRDYLNLLKLFWGIEGLNKTFFTNLDESSTLIFINNLLIAELPFYTETIKGSDGYIYDTDVEKAYSGNFIEIDNKVSSLIKNLEIVKEGAQIEVLNGSSIAGFAGKNKRIISNAGGNIVNSGNYPEKAEESVIYLNGITLDNIPFTIDYIKSLFPNISISKKEYKYNTIGNIILVLGDK